MAEAQLGAHNLSLYMSSAGYDKVSSVAPCIGFLTKALAADSKVLPLMTAVVETEVVKFNVATLCSKACEDLES